MFLNIGTKYKSLQPFQSAIELPDFVVLSGLNGSGKTQLLEAIHKGAITLFGDNRDLQRVKFVDHNTLVPNDGVIVSASTLRVSVQNLVNQYNLYIERLRNTPRITLETLFGKSKDVKLIKDIAQIAGKDITSLSNEDFFKHSPINYQSESVDANIFHQNFSTLFKKYQTFQVENDFNEYLNNKRGGVKFLSDEEFTRKYGEPPWLLVSQIIKEAGLEYQITTPENESPDTPFQLKLVNNINSAEIDFRDLSSGEMVIMSLTLALYNAKFNIAFPQVLLMDEPDAHLHPSMTKKFIDVIQNVFVGEKGVKVILTTHSPSTIALAPEESLFIMSKTEPRIVKASKDYALQIQTAGVPMLSINYENRRQVFVESEYDAVCYGKIYDKLRDKLVPQISISFISSGVGGQGSCDQVKEIVNKLTGYGNRFIYGIIDWDTRNDGNEFVKVLGKDQRHSIENYIFDPVILGAFLLREKFINRAEFGFDERDRYTDFNSFADTKLQNIADVIVNQIRARVSDTSDITVQKVEYVGGIKINLPRWFLRIQGHELETLIKEIFPQLNRFRGEGGLKKEIIDKVIDDIPEFIPKDILVLLSEIQNYKG